MMKKKTTMTMRKMMVEMKMRILLKRKKVNSTTLLTSRASWLVKIC